MPVPARKHRLDETITLPIRRPRPTAGRHPDPRRGSPPSPVDHDRDRDHGHGHDRDRDQGHDSLMNELERFTTLTFRYTEDEPLWSAVLQRCGLRGAALECAAAVRLASRCRDAAHVDPVAATRELARARGALHDYRGVLYQSLSRGLLSTARYDRLHRHSRRVSEALNVAQRRQLGRLPRVGVTPPPPRTVPPWPSAPLPPPLPLPPLRAPLPRPPPPQASPPSSAPPPPPRAPLPPPSPQRRPPPRSRGPWTRKPENPKTRKPESL